MGNFFTIIGAGIGLLVSVRALLSMSELEQVFLTQEQLIKLKLYRLISLSLYIGLLASDIYLIWNLIMRGKTIYTTDWNNVIGLGIFCAILGAIIISILSSIIEIFSRYHFKHKVYIQGTGDLYIHKMLNQDVCICLKDPNTDINRNNSESFLISISEIHKQPIIRTKIQRPQTKIQKLLRYNFAQSINT